MKETYKTKTNHGDFSLLANAATQVWNWDQEIKCTNNFAAKWTKLSPPFCTTNINNLQFQAQILCSFVLMFTVLTEQDSNHWLTRNLCL